MRETRAGIRLIAVLIAAAALAPLPSRVLASSAGPTVQLSVGASYQNYPDEVVSAVRNAVSDGEPVSAVVEFNSGGTAAHASGNASAKGHEVFSSGSTSRDVVAIQCEISSFTFTFLTPGAPGHNGETAYVTAQLSVSDELRHTPGGGFYTLDAGVEFAVEQGITYRSMQQGSFFDGGPEWGPDSFGSFTVTFPLTIGEETSFLLGVGSRAAFGTLDGTPLDSSFEMSVAWLGVSSVTDVQGHPIEGFTLTDDSGVNWLTAVPEPGCLVCASGPLVVLGSRRRRMACR